MWTLVARLPLRIEQGPAPSPATPTLLLPPLPRLFPSFPPPFPVIPAPLLPVIPAPLPSSFPPPSGNLPAPASARRPATHSVAPDLIWGPNPTSCAAPRSRATRRRRPRAVRDLAPPPLPVMPAPSPRHSRASSLVIPAPEREPPRARLRPPSRHPFRRPRLDLGPKPNVVRSAEIPSHPPTPSAGSSGPRSAPSPRHARASSPVIPAPFSPSFPPPSGNLPAPASARRPATHSVAPDLIWGLCGGCWRRGVPESPRTLVGGALGTLTSRKGLGLGSRSSLERRILEARGWRLRAGDFPLKPSATSGCR